MNAPHQLQQFVELKFAMTASEIENMLRAANDVSDHASELSFKGMPAGCHMHACQ